MRRALVTGITGQDGSYLAELLLDKGYEVHGLVRRSSGPNRSRLGDLEGRALTLHHGDMTDGVGLASLVRDVEPHEVYNLAAQSHVKVSFETPEHTASTNAIGPIRLLEAIRSSGRPIRFYQASTSEMFGSAPSPQDETTSFWPRSPYGAAKLHAHWATVNYRQAHGVFAVSGIAFNHESPRRGEDFVTRKITRAVAAIEAGLESRLALGNVKATRDWGYAPEYVEAMWRTLQQDEPDDYVFATGHGMTVEDFCRAAFAHAELDHRDFVVYDATHERPSEVDALIGNPTKSRRLLGWEPKVTGDDLARIMVDADRELLRRR